MVERFVRAMTSPPLAPAKFKGIDILTINDWKELK